MTPTTLHLYAASERALCGVVVATGSYLLERVTCPQCLVLLDVMLGLGLKPLRVWGPATFGRGHGRVRRKRAKGFTTPYRFLNARRTSAWLAARGIDLTDPAAVTRLLALEHTTP